MRSPTSAGSEGDSGSAPSSSWPRGVRQGVSAPGEMGTSTMPEISRVGTSASESAAYAARQTGFAGMAYAPSRPAGTVTVAMRCRSATSAIAPEGAPTIAPAHANCVGAALAAMRCRHPTSAIAPEGAPTAASARRVFVGAASAAIVGLTTTLHPTTDNRLWPAPTPHAAGWQRCTGQSLARPRRRAAHGREIRAAILVLRCAPAAN